MAIGSGKQFEMGRVIERTMGVLSGNIGVFAVLALLLGALPTVILEVIQAKVLGFPAVGGGLPSAGPLQWGMYAAALLLAMVCAYTLQGAVVRGAVVSLGGGKASLGDCLQTGLQVFLPAFAISLLAGLGEMAGFILLIVPGIILALAWMVAIPVRVMERRGVVAALTRSAELTRGHRWSLFLMFVVLIILYFVLTLLLGLVFGILFAALPNVGTTRMAPLIAQPVVGAISSIVSAAFVASVYYELRTMKEGVGADTLVKVFE